MRTIGFVDYYLGEWHANNYPAWITAQSGGEFVVQYAWAELNKSPVNGVTTAEWCQKYGVTPCATLKELCEKADCILVLAPSDPDKHLGYAQEVFRYKKKTYIDKTFAPDFVTAKKIFDLAAQYDTPFFSTSALRYSDELVGIKDARAMLVTGGGSNFDEYVVHLVEQVVKAMPGKPVKVRAEIQGNQTVGTVVLENGRIATVVYADGFPYTFGAQLGDGQTVFRTVESDFFGNLIADIVRFYKTGVVPFNPQETLYVMQIREGLIRARAKSGEWIAIE